MTETIFVTGADRGLGFSIAQRFLRAGFHVFGGFYHSSANLEDLGRAFPGKLSPIALDVSDLGSIRRAVGQVAEQITALDMLINNAGIHLEDHQTPLEELDFGNLHLEKSMAVNAFGPLRLTQLLYPLLSLGRRKLILNISSEAGSITDCRREREFAYCMSKAALNMETKILHNSLSPRGFTVLAVHPGWVQTEMGGPDAVLHPDLSAEAIYSLATRDWPREHEIFMDYQGIGLPW